jgi:cell division protein ZapA
MGALKIDLLGTSFTIKASEDDLYLKKLLGYYTKLIDQIRSSGILKDKLQMSILAGIMLCDELYKEKSEKTQIHLNPPADSSSVILDKDESDRAEQIAIDLIEKINKVLA